MLVNQYSGARMTASLRDPRTSKGAHRLLRAQVAAGDQHRLDGLVEERRRRVHRRFEAPLVADLHGL